MLRSNPYQASNVKRADGCPTGAGWPSVKQVVNRHFQAIAADLISLAGHSLWAAPNTYGGSMFPVAHGRRKTVAPAGVTSEKLFCALVPVFSIARAVSWDTPS